MEYIINADVARKYNVSEPAVNKWVKHALEGKNNLQVMEVNNKVHILDNLHNDIELTRLAENGKKYRSSLSQKVVEVSPKIYETFTEEEIISIIADLQFKSSINRKFGYKGIGAKLWDNYYQLGISDINHVIKPILSRIYLSVEEYLSKDNQINVFDFGCGNGEPVKDLLHDLENNNVLGKYVAVDISAEMLNICSQNIQNNFQNLEVKTYLKDFETSQFGKLILENKNSSQKGDLIMYTGNTICNHDDRTTVLKNIKSGMLSGDLLAVSYSIDSVNNKSAFRYANDKDSTMRQAWFLQDLGIDVDLCDAVNRYEPELGAKVKYLKLDKNYLIKFNLFGNTKEVELIQGQEISIWRHYLLSIEQIISELKSCGFRVLSYQLDQSRSNALVVCEVG